MKLKTFGTPLLLILARICSGQTIQSDPEIFPMQKGTRWIYRGEVAWEGKGGAVLRKRLDWTMGKSLVVVSDRDQGTLHGALRNGR